MSTKQKPKKPFWYKKWKEKQHKELKAALKEDKDLKQRFEAIQAQLRPRD